MLWFALALAFTMAIADGWLLPLFKTCTHWSSGCCSFLLWCHPFAACFRSCHCWIVDCRHFLLWKASFSVFVSTVTTPSPAMPSTFHACCYCCQCWRLIVTIFMFVHVVGFAVAVAVFTASPAMPCFCCLLLFLPLTTIDSWMLILFSCFRCLCPSSAMPCFCCLLILLLQSPTVDCSCCKH